MVENNFGFNDDEIVHCPTEEEAIQVLKIAHERGFKWRSEEPYLTYTNWSHYKKNTCYNLSKGFYDGIDGIKSCFKNSIIITSEEFLKQHLICNKHKPFLVW